MCRVVSLRCTASNAASSYIGSDISIPTLFNPILRSRLSYLHLSASPIK